MRWGYTADTRSMATKLMCRVTGGNYSHVFPIFYGPDCGRPLYFESICKRDLATGKTGVRGPILLCNVRMWRNQHPKRRRFVTQPEYGYLPFDDQECTAAYKTLAAATHNVTYAPTQIVRNWLKQRLRVNLYFGHGSQDDWTCSETCARVTPARLQHHFDLGRYNYDDITPSGPRLMSVERATEAMIADVGTRTE